MSLNRSIFDVFIYTDTELPFAGRENVFCVLENARSQLNKTVQHEFCEDVLEAVANSNADLDMAQKIQRGRLFVQEKRIWTELTCAVSLAGRILNMCQIGYDIHISLNFSFEFGGIILMLFIIMPV